MFLCYSRPRLKTEASSQAFSVLSYKIEKGVNVARGNRVWRWANLDGGGGNVGVIVVANLTLIDLTGLTNVAVEGQPESIVADIKNMRNCIHLAISPVNQDLATSDAIKISRGMDPKGERTFGVLTKADLMDKGTSAVDILEGQSYKLLYPWVGVINCSQADINKSIDTIVACCQREFWVSGPEYKHIAHRMCSEFLAKMISKHLENVIKSRIPGLQSHISKTVVELETELSRLGKPGATDAGGKLYMIMDICRRFDQIFKEHLDGVWSGGDKIYGVIDNQLPASLKKLQFDKQHFTENVRKLITETEGYQPHPIAPEQGYRPLIESCFGSIKGPAEAAIDAELRQYPTLRVEVSKAAVESLQRARDECKRAALQLVDMECCYLTVDFFPKLPQDVEKGGNPTHSISDRYNDLYLCQNGSTVLSYMNMVCGSLRNSIPKSIVYCQIRVAKRSLLDHFFTELGGKEAKVLGKMMVEDPAIMQKRTNLAEVRVVQGCPI